MNLLFAFFPLFASINPALLNEVTPFSSPHHFAERYSEADREFQRRWDKFARGRSFAIWTPGRSKESITEEFKKLHALRINTWFVDTQRLLRSRPDFAIAEELIYGDYVRESNCIAFNYNKACTYYNASLVHIGPRYFLAMMGPREKDVHSFFRLLLDASVSALVRLTPAQEGAVSKCYPYWEERTPGNCLQIPFGKDLISLPYFTLENWMDNQGNEPKELYEFVQKIRTEHDPNSGPLGVHCTNGVGRTGTVIAAIALLDEAERQIKAGVSPQNIQISVEETVLRLSLQRFYMCAQIPQYESLYRILEFYKDKASEKLDKESHPFKVSQLRS